MPAVLAYLRVPPPHVSSSPYSDPQTSRRGHSSLPEPHFTSDLCILTSVRPVERYLPPHSATRSTGQAPVYVIPRHITECPVNTNWKGGADMTHLLFEASPDTPGCSQSSCLLLSPWHISKLCSDRVAWWMHIGRPASPALLVPEDRDAPSKSLYSLCPMPDQRPSTQNLCREGGRWRGCWRDGGVWAENGKG